MPRWDSVPWAPAADRMRQRKLVSDRGGELEVADRGLFVHPPGADGLGEAGKRALLVGDEP